jgi:hypothetical protein
MTFCCRIAEALTKLSAAAALAEPVPPRASTLVKLGAAAALAEPVPPSAKPPHLFFNMAMFTQGRFGPGALAVSLGNGPD